MDSQEVSRRDFGKFLVKLLTLGVPLGIILSAIKTVDAPATITPSKYALSRATSVSGDPFFDLEVTSPETLAGTGRMVMQTKDDQGTIAYSLEMGGGDQSIKLYTHDGSTLRSRLRVLRGAIGVSEVLIVEANLRLAPAAGGGTTTFYCTESQIQCLAPLILQGFFFDYGPNGTPSVGSEAARSRAYGTDRGDANPEFLDVQALTQQDFRVTVNKTGGGSLRPLIFFQGATEAYRIDTAARTKFSKEPAVPTYTEASKPTAATAGPGSIIFVSDGGAGNKFQGSDGSTWLGLG